MTAPSHTRVIRKMAEAIYAAIGRRIRLARELRKLTQYELADAMGRTRASIQQMERGSQRIHIHTLIEIARLLKVPAISLVVLTNPPTRSAASPKR